MICRVCSHPARKEIDRALVAGQPKHGIARQHGLTSDAVERHAKTHLPQKLAKAQSVRDQVEADDLLGQLRLLQGHTLAILGEARANGEYKLGLSAINTARSNIELLGRLLGELDQPALVNVTVSHEWLALKGRLLDALAPYPQARFAAAQALLAGGLTEASDESASEENGNGAGPRD
jgi:hypothetical protein